MLKPPQHSRKINLKKLIFIQTFNIEFDPKTRRKVSEFAEKDKSKLVKGKKPSSCNQNSIVNIPKISIIIPSSKIIIDTKTTFKGDFPDILDPRRLLPIIFSVHTFKFDC